MNIEDVVALYMANIIDRAEARNLAGLDEPESVPEKTTVLKGKPLPTVLSGKPLEEEPKRFTKSEVEDMTTKDFMENRAAILKQLANEGKTLTITKDSSVYETLTAVLDRLED